jgi:hypothetical protein
VDGAPEDPADSKNQLNNITILGKFSYAAGGNTI